VSDTRTDVTPKEAKGLSKNKLILLISVLLGIVLLGSGVIGASFIIPKSITGAWQLVVNPEVAAATDDEVPESERVYYVFDKADRYGRGEYRLCYQGGVEYLEYELMEKDSVKKVNLGAEDMEYIITGSKLLNNAKLTLVYPGYTDENTGETYEAQKYIFVQAKNPLYEKASYKDYEVDKKLVGEWVNNQRSLSYYYYAFYYTQTVDIKDNGVMVIRYESEDLGLDRYIYYSYTAKDNELTFSLVTDKESKYTVAYEFDENGNLKFIDDTTTASIFADAFFGDFTFYTPENLPTPTEASADEIYYIE